MTLRHPRDRVLAHAKKFPTLKRSSASKSPRKQSADSLRRGRVVYDAELSQVALFAAGTFCARAPCCLAGLPLVALPCLRAILRLLDETRGQAGARLGARLLVQRGEMVLNSAQAYAQLCRDMLERPLVRDHCGENVAFPFRESIRFAECRKGLLRGSRGNHLGGFSAGILRTLMVGRFFGVYQLFGIR